MAEYIDKQALIGFLDDIQQPKMPITEGFKFITIDEAIRVISERPTADVIERAKVLDQIKEAREEVAKGWYTRPANRYEEGKKDRSLECMKILDKLIAEVEG